MTRTYLEMSDVPPVLINAAREAFGYAGRSFKAEAAESLRLDGNYWDGGSRSTYAGVNLMTGAVSSAVKDHGNPFSSPQTPTVDIPVGCAIMEHSIFCGKDTGITFHVNPQNVAALLPPKAEITVEEAIVIEYTCSRKSSYAGIKDFRFHEAFERTGITRAAWETAKAACIAGGYLNKAGAVTPKGRNARSTHGHTFHKG